MTKKRPQEAKRSTTAPARFSAGDEVEPAYGLLLPELPGVCFEGWTGIVEKVDRRYKPPRFLVRWSQETLAGLTKASRKRLGEIGMTFEAMWLHGEDLEPVKPVRCFAPRAVDPSPYEDTWDTGDWEGLDRKWPDWEGRNWEAWLRASLSFPFRAKRFEDDDKAYFTEWPGESRSGWGRGCSSSGLPDAIPGVMSSWSRPGRGGFGDPCRSATWKSSRRTTRTTGRSGSTWSGMPIAVEDAPRSRMVGREGVILPAVAGSPLRESHDPRNLRSGYPIPVPTGETLGMGEGRLRVECGGRAPGGGDRGGPRDVGRCRAGGDDRWRPPGDDRGVPPGPLRVPLRGGEPAPLRPAPRGGLGLIGGGLVGVVAGLMVVSLPLEPRGPHRRDVLGAVYGLARTAAAGIVRGRPPRDVRWHPLSAFRQDRARATTGASSGAARAGRRAADWSCSSSDRCT